MKSTPNDAISALMSEYEIFENADGKWEIQHHLDSNINSAWHATTFLDEKRFASREKAINWLSHHILTSRKLEVESILHEMWAYERAQEK